MKTMAAILAVTTTMFNQHVQALQQATRSTDMNLDNIDGSSKIRLDEPEGNYSQKASRAWIMRQEFLQRRDERKRRRSASVLSYRSRYPRRKTQRRNYSSRQREEKPTQTPQQQVDAARDEKSEEQLNPHQLYWQRMNNVRSKEREGREEFLDVEKDNIQRIKEEGDSLEAISEIAD